MRDGDGRWQPKDLFFKKGAFGISPKTLYTRGFLHEETLGGWSGFGSRGKGERETFRRTKEFCSGPCVFRVSSKQEYFLSASSRYAYRAPSQARNDSLRLFDAVWARLSAGGAGGVSCPVCSRENTQTAKFFGGFPRNLFLKKGSLGRRRQTLACQEPAPTTMNKDGGKKCQFIY